MLKKLIKKIREYDNVVAENIKLKNTLSQQENLHLVIKDKENSLNKSLLMGFMFSEALATAFSNIEDSKTRLEIVESLKDAFTLKDNISINPNTPEVEKILNSNLEKMLD